MVAERTPNKVGPKFLLFLILVLFIGCAQYPDAEKSSGRESRPPSPEASQELAQKQVVDSDHEPTNGSNEKEHAENILDQVQMAEADFEEPPIPPIKERSILASGKAFLISNQVEEQGYGLYSYLLFGSKPLNELQRKRYLKSIEAFMHFFEDIEELEKNSEMPRDTLNITYLPVDPEPTSSKPKNLLEIYDYPRAKALLSLFEENLQDGPYIISTFHRLSLSDQPAEAVILQDLSSESPRVIHLWIKKFLAEARSKDFKENDRLKEGALWLRSLTANITDATEEAMVGLKQAGDFAEELGKEFDRWTRIIPFKKATLAPTE